MKSENVQGRFSVSNVPSLAPRCRGPDPQLTPATYTTFQNLNLILLTSSELYGLRRELKQLKSKNSLELFEILYVV